MPSLRGLSSPTCWNPSRSHQKWCDSSMSRTLRTRWFTPTGVTALVGALISSDVVLVSPIGEPPSVRRSVGTTPGGGQLLGPGGDEELGTSRRRTRTVVTAVTEHLFVNGERVMTAASG